MPPPAPRAPQGHPAEVLRVALQLGLSSFGLKLVAVAASTGLIALCAAACGPAPYTTPRTSPWLPVRSCCS